MFIPCWNCEQDVWIETQKECRHCGEVSRRCADCQNYALETSICKRLTTEVPRAEAQHPLRLALSMNCQYYVYDPAARARQAAQSAQTAPPPAPAAAVVAPPVKAPPTPQAPPGREVITIVREAAPRRPKHPIIIAHRGNSSAAPENTLAAFSSALAAGARAVELDVHISRDGHAVVIHDATVDRCSNGTGAVRDMTLEELKSLDAGSWFAPEFSGERIPTLDEAIEALPAPTLVIIHLRAHENESDRCERAVVEAVAKHQLYTRCVVSHHTRHGLQRIRDLDPKIHLCWIGPGGEAASEYVDDAYYMGYRFIHPMLRDVDEHLVAYAHEREMWVSVFWADEVDDMRRLIKLGVDGIITNRPAFLQEVLREATAAS